jgi:hypothetical protein
MPQLGQDGNPRRRLIVGAIMMLWGFAGSVARGCPFQPAGRLEPFHFAYAEHRGDACNWKELVPLWQFK